MYINIQGVQIVSAFMLLHISCTKQNIIDLLNSLSFDQQQHKYNKNRFQIQLWQRRTPIIEEFLFDHMS